MYFEYFQPCVFPIVTIPSNLSQVCNRISFNSEGYKALSFRDTLGYQNPIPVETRDGLLKFSGMKGELAENHVKKFIELI